MSFPFQVDPVAIEYAWQAGVIVLALLVAVRFARLARPGARGRTWVAAGAALLGLLLVTHALHRTWPRGWRALFVLLTAVTVYAFSLLTYRYATRPISRRDRRLLLGLRTVALIAAVLALLRPAFVKRRETREKPGIYFLYDTSRSMALRDGADGTSRIEELIAMRTVSRRDLDRLKRSFQVLEYGMDAEIVRIDELARRPTGSATSIGPALMNIASRTERRQVAAIVVLSDGAHNAGTEPDHVVPVLRGRKIPLYTVGVGGRSALRDVAVKALHCNATVFTKNVFPVVGELVLRGCAGETVKLELLLDDEPVATEEITATEAAASTRVTMSFAPEEVGIHKITIRAVPITGEIAPDNNEASTYVNVLPGGLGVLYVEGKVRWEYKFLRRTLEASPDFQVTPALILAPLPAAQQDRLPEGIFNWNRYECIILGDVKPDVFTTRQLEALRTAVDQGGKGVIMIGGYHAFGPGGWHATPLADVLPVKMAPGDPQVSGLYKLEPTRPAERHFVLQIEEDERASRAAWDTLRPLDGATGFTGPKRGAEVLAIGRNVNTGGKGPPLLVAHNYGKGRAMALAANSTWRWAFAEKDTLKYHKRFWRQVVLWLTRRDKAQGEQMWVTLSKQRLKVGQDLEIIAHVQDALGRPITDCVASAVITKPDGKADNVTFGYQTDDYRVTFQPPDGGDYTITATATRDGKEIGSAEARFIAYVPDVELDQPAPEFDRLKSLASQTDGAFFTPEQAADLFERLKKRVLPDTVIVHTDVIPLWDNWGLLAVFLAALTAEWVLRKRKGMV